MLLLGWQEHLVDDMHDAIAARDIGCGNLAPIAALIFDIDAAIFDFSFEFRAAERRDIGFAAIGFGECNHVCC